jgi:hypothetical protein
MSPLSRRATGSDPFSETAAINRTNSQMENGIDLGASGAATNSIPRLPYKLGQHRKNWAMWFLCFCFDGCVLPIALFYSLWFGSSLTHWNSKSVCWIDGQLGDATRGHRERDGD